MPATLSELEQQNPNLRSQIEEWQSERIRSGQNPMDWAAFRQHVMALGAPDPGQEAPREFMQSGVGNAASEVMGRVTGQQQERQPQEGQPQEQQGEKRGGGLLGGLFGNR